MDVVRIKISSYDCLAPQTFDRLAGSDGPYTHPT